MKRSFVISLLLASLSVILGVGLWLSLPQGELDTSWINEVYQLLDDAKPYPIEEEYHRPYMGYAVVYYFDNGSRQVVFNGGNERRWIVTELENILFQVNEQKNLTVNEDFVDAVLSTCNVVELKTRLYDDFHRWENFDTALFILQDSLNKGLDGSFIIRQIIDGQRRWSRWAITK